MESFHQQGIKRGSEKKKFFEGKVKNPIKQPLLIKEKDILTMKAEKLKDDFIHIIDDYDLIDYLGKGSYGLVAKVIFKYYIQ
jgi:hypothetical protein